MDVVADRRPVRRGVIAAINRQPLAPARRRLGDEREEVVGDPARVLADQRGGVRPYRVEISQGNCREVGLRHHQVVDRLLDHQLGPPVRVDRTERRILPDGNPLRHPVDRRRRREDQPPHPMAQHGLEERHRAPHVHRHVAQRLRDGLAHRLQPRHVDHRIDPELPEHRLQPRRIADVPLDHVRHAVPERRDPFRHVAGRVGEVVEDHHPPPAGQQRGHHMRPDVPGPAGGEHRRHQPCFIITWRGTV